VVNVLARHGFGEVLLKIRIWESVHIERSILHRSPPVIMDISAGARLRMALEEMGPTYIKLGQMLSTRPDIVPPDIISELKKLQNSVRFIPPGTIRTIIESEFGKKIEQIFDSFDETPLAAASLAQVHRAVLDGKQVVLKVRRPRVVEETETDFGILRSLAVLADRYSPSLYQINPTGLVEEFSQQIRKELDFLMESHNMIRFANDFKKEKGIRVPHVYSALCTKRVITMEYLDGINISDVASLHEQGYDLPLIARRGAEFGYKAIFDYGFFHADPHPGNIIILPDNVIGLVDYGMMASLSLRDRERLAKLVYFIAMRDDKRVARALNELMESEDLIPSEDLEPAMTAIINEFGDLQSCEMYLARMLFAMMKAIVSHGGRFRPQLIWLTKSLASQEDMACSLNADFNLMEIGKPFAYKLITRKFNPLSNSRELLYWLVDSMDTIRDLPYDIGVVMKELRKGRIKIEFEHMGLEPIRKTMERISYRNVLSNIIVALLVSSSVVTLAKIPPFVAGISALGFVGYLIALILAVILVWNVFVSSRRR